MLNQNEGYYLQVRYRPVGDTENGWAMIGGRLGQGPMDHNDATALLDELEFWAEARAVPVEYRMVRLEVVE